MEKKTHKNPSNHVTNESSPKNNAFKNTKPDYLKEYCEKHHPHIIMQMREKIFCETTDQKKTQLKKEKTEGR